MDPPADRDRRRRRRHVLSRHKRPRRPNPQRRARPSGPGRIAHMRRKPRGFRRFGSRAFFGTVPKDRLFRNERTLPAHHARAGKTDRVRKYPSSQPVVSPQTCTTERTARDNPCKKRPEGAMPGRATDPAKIRTLGTSTQTDYVPIPDAMALAALWAQTDLQGRPPVRSLEGVVADSAGSGRSSERPYC